MEERTIGFIIWTVSVLPIFILGVFCIVSTTQRQFGFWSNIPKVEVKDVRSYNRALGKLFVGSSIGIELLGLPLLVGDDSPLILLSIIGTMILVIITMIIYVLVIEPKYRKKPTE